MAMIKCKECGREVSSIAKTCPGCGAPVDTRVFCPKCGSDRTSVISGASKALSIAMWGVFAANKVRSTYKCDVCGHKF